MTWTGTQVYSHVREHNLQVAVGPLLDLPLQHGHKLCLEWNIQAAGVVSIHMDDQNIILSGRKGHLHSPCNY